MIDGNDGDWQTDSVALRQHINRDDRNYIMVALSLNFLNPFLTLLLPSVLIILADVFSFSLPLEGQGHSGAQLHHVPQHPQRSAPRRQPV